MNCNVFKNAAELNVIITKNGGESICSSMVKVKRKILVKIVQLTSRDSFQYWLSRKFPTCMRNCFILYWIAVELELH